jgi:hypothetical protein
MWSGKARVSGKLAGRHATPRRRSSAQPPCCQPALAKPKPRVPEALAWCAAKCADTTTTRRRSRLKLSATAPCMAERGQDWFRSCPADQPAWPARSNGPQRADTGRRQPEKAAAPHTPPTLLPPTPITPHATLVVATSPTTCSSSALRGARRPGGGGQGAVQRGAKRHRKPRRAQPPAAAPGTHAPGSQPLLSQIERPPVSQGPAPPSGAPHKGGH